MVCPRGGLKFSFPGRTLSPHGVQMLKWETVGPPKGLLL